MKVVIGLGYGGGNRVGYEGGNRVGYEGGNRVGYEGGNRVGYEGGNRLGYEGGNRVGYEGGNRVGYEGGNRLGNEGGNRLGYEGGNRVGYEGGNRVGYEGGNRVGYEGGNRLVLVMHQNNFEANHFRNASMSMPSAIVDFIVNIVNIVCLFLLITFCSTRHRCRREVVATFSSSPNTNIHPVNVGSGSPPSPESLFSIL